ncbi:hypothetical protein [Laceyella putida]|jgi:hypothetical protein|uniref:Uncharacterized protein n=1 Tax=Laceyella putida TaxID=110101 RepID=A0ABW2RI50_9BACL
MFQPSPVRESHLKRMIRKIVKEELNSMHKKKDQPPAQKEGTDDTDDLLSQFKAPRLAEDLDTGTWTIFGVLEPLSSFHDKQARALPGFPELYRPDFSGFESTPYLPKYPKRSD